MQGMAKETVKRVSTGDIQLVQNLTERCLQLYMNQEEVVQTLLAQAKIEPDFTELELSHASMDKPPTGKAVEDREMERKGN